MQSVEQISLKFSGDTFLGLEVQDRGALGTEDRPLVTGGHVATRPVLGPGNRATGRIEHYDESRQVFVDAAESVIDPGA